MLAWLFCAKTLVERLSVESLCLVVSVLTLRRDGSASAVVNLPGVVFVRLDARILELDCHFCQMLEDMPDECFDQCQAPHDICKLAAPVGALLFYC